MTLPVLIPPGALKPGPKAPQVGLCGNPMTGMRPHDMRVVAIGTRIRDVAPQQQAYIVCRYNGEWLLREHWGERLQSGDILEFYEMPQNRAVLQVVLYIVAAVVSYFATPAAGAAVLALGNVAINLLVPPRGPSGPQQQEAALGVFSTSLAGNAARLDQPIWKNCGRPKITPPFAASPYVEYQSSDPANPTLNCDQYYFALFAVGVGNHTLEKAFIGKTAIAHFQDVLTAMYLPPGTPPSRVQANVVTSDEVAAGLELTSVLYAGGYAACRPGDQAVSIGIDVSASQGLGRSNGSSITVSWEVQVRTIDDFGAPLDNWATVADESRTAFTNTPQRWSNRYTLSAPRRVEVRVGATYNKDSDASARDGIQWFGLRAYLARPAPLNPATAYYEVVMRASEQLSQFSQRDFSLIVRSLVRTWSPGAGWGPEVFTRNPAWWLAELWTNADWGEGLPDARVDLQGLYDWSLTLDARQDHFDYSFVSSLNSWDAAQLIARAGRARAFRRNGIYTIARDELIDLPVAAFTPRNTQPKSMVLHAKLPQREAADGIVVQYQNNVIWDTASIDCPCPGFTVSDFADPRYDPTLPQMQNPVFVTLDGVTGAKHAEREGLYQAASMSLRQTTVSAAVEMEGVLVAFMDPIRWQPQILGYGQSGDVAFWDSTTLVMGLTEPADFTNGAPYLTLQRDDGSLTTPVPVLPGPTEWDVLLPAAPDFELVLDDGTRERPKFILGPLESCDELVKITSIGDGGKTEDGAQLYDITALVDDDRVHLADVHLLPGPGDIQDPIDDGVTTSNVDFQTVINLDARVNKQLSHAIQLDGMNPDWVLRFSMPAGQRFTAWSEFASDGDSFVIGGHPWYNNFMVTGELHAGGINFGAPHVSATAEGARAAFDGASVTGSQTYYFWINSDGVGDNRGGLSILVTKD